MRKLLVDYHLHPGVCIDAAPHDLQSYCRRAVDLNLREICFTPHLEVDPVRRHLDGFVRLDNNIHPMSDQVWLDRYFEELNICRGEFQHQGLGIKAGLEVGYVPGQEDRIATVLDSYPFDYVLGSVHCLNHVAISNSHESRVYYPGRNWQQVGKDYYEVLLHSVNCKLFDCIGHIDLYRRYGEQYLAADWGEIHRKYAGPVFKAMVNQGVGLEINTSSLRRGQREFHPNLSMFKAALEAGISTITVGSDAHCLEELGHGIEEAINLLLQHGLEPARFTKRQRI